MYAFRFLVRSDSYGKPRLITVYIYKSPPLDCILSHFNPLHFIIHRLGFIWILSAHSRLIFHIFRHDIYTRLPSLMRATRFAHSPSFIQPNNIYRRIKIVELWRLCRLENTARNLSFRQVVLLFLTEDGFLLLFCVHITSCTERVAASKNQRSNYSFYVTLNHVP